MLTKNIKFKLFRKKKLNENLKKKLTTLLNEENLVIKSLKKEYKNNFNKKTISKFKNFINYRVIGMGGSSLGTQAIYDFLEHKIKKKFEFLDNLKSHIKKNKKKRYLNLIISKSGNTTETIVNTNIFVQKKNKNIFITENKKNYLNILAKKFKSEIIHHNNFIGGRYSVLSEVGMLPAELMGLNEKKFKRYNFLIKNKNFLNQLVANVSTILKLISQKKLNSIILNYDDKSNNLFQWYQQLVAESLGKKSNGILPFISTMPKDNHSLMQLFLDGPKNNFYTFFNVKEKKSKNKNLYKLKNAQFEATKIVFNRKKLPFRTFEVLNRTEETMGELFSFFILETILLGRALNVNPFDQPSVELIKKETKKILF